MTSTFTLVAQHAARLFDRSLDTLKPETHLADDLRADSLDTWEFLLSLEQEFGITFADSDVDGDGLSTLGDVAALVDRKLAKKAAG